MTFWGAKLKPKKPFLIEREELDGRRLHLSQATLGQNATGGERSIVKCKSGESPAVYLCSLKPGLSESCSLDLYFEDDVIFSVTGTTPVYLSGYFMEDEDEDEEGEEFSEDEYDQEFIAGTEDDDDVDDDEEDDEEDEDDVPFKASGVKIEEITADEPGKAEAKVEPLATEPKVEDKPKGDDAMGEDKDSDEDGFALPKRKGAPEESSPKKSAKTSASDTPSEAKKNINKKKKGKKAANQEESVPVPEEGNGDANVVQEKKSGKKDKSAKKFPNGLEVMDLAIGKPDGKQAKPGKKVFISYIGKLKSTGKIFDSNIGRKPFQFRLGVNEVVKGFDIGVNGMRVGDKRRVIIPPSMGYGAKAVGSIPPNSWLIFDIELVDVA